MLFAYATFILLNLHNNPPLSDLRNVVGEPCALIARKDETHTEILSRIDSHQNIFKLGHTVEQGHSEHPLQGLTMAETGENGGPLSDDVYDLPPGLVTRERLYMS